MDRKEKVVSRRVTRSQTKVYNTFIATINSHHKEVVSEAPSNSPFTPHTTSNLTCATASESRMFGGSEKNSQTKLVYSANISIPTIHKMHGLGNFSSEQTHMPESRILSAIGSSAQIKAEAARPLSWVCRSTPMNSPSTPCGQGYQVSETYSSRTKRQRIKHYESSSTPWAEENRIVPATRPFSSSHLKFHERNQSSELHPSNVSTLLNGDLKDGSQTALLVGRLVSSKKRNEASEQPSSSVQPTIPKGHLKNGGKTAGVLAGQISNNQILVKDAIAESTLVQKQSEENTNNLDSEIRELGPSLSLNLSEMANMWHDDHSNQDEAEVLSSNSSLVTVHGYRVKETAAPILHKIFGKYGDIAVNCLMERVEIRSYFLEKVCDVVQMLENSKLEELTQLEITDMLDLVDDLMRGRLDVAWLQQRLKKISEAKQILKHSSTLKETKAKNSHCAEESKKRLENFQAVKLKIQEKICLIEDHLNATQEESRKIERTISEAIAKQGKTNMK
ncbi:uncharacterized protein LOC110822299 isoform X2 [Carica papaya]|uniref:uncharacterized protein LOC110822299 isoform X2 n=1 Tax=Carica papaya TaxID=3649 RepID=UPI000B8C78F6|nr:uncharacterized protein LOC110822299 isoform X2 [Carica papaya]